MKYVWKSRVKQVEERFCQVNHRKDDNGKMTSDSESIGWWITDTDHICHYVGKEKPELVPGNMIKITMEK